ncbi:MAG: N-acetylmuramoyl-L-alanine amidase [Candidatus Peribacteraceae bacterium]|nr:N-acetylmuramoyl-L-alanine amidase [Candidatus Peribacteraceae bacterium]
MRRILLSLLALSLSMPMPAPAAAPAIPDMRETAFDPPIDALSAGGNVIDAEVSSWDGERWTAWETLQMEDEQDPLSTESNLVMFPTPVSKVRLRGKTPDLALHPIRVSHEPAGIRTASLVSMDYPSILSRHDWGADESLLYANGSAPVGNGDSDRQSAVSSASSASSLPARIQNCLDTQRQYPTEFRTARAVTTDGQGNRYLWPQEYSPSVRLLVVHHTAMTVSSDSRPAEERMRAIYQYHAKTLGWGDIGYHYVIDENGLIYQGRTGGEAVVGGHVYCNNIGTVGIALMGNFETEQPSQTQMQSLQRLINTLGDQYGIDLNRSVAYHGKIFPPVVGHRDLLATACPGYYVANTMDQVLRNVRSGNLSASIVFPPPPAPPSSSSSRASVSRSSSPQEGFIATGDTTLVGRPGGEVSLALQYRAGRAINRRRSLGTIKRSHPQLGVWVAMGTRFVRALANVPSPESLRPGQTTTLRLKIQLPRDRGTYQLTIGNVTFTVVTEGKRLQVPVTRNSGAQDYLPSQTPDSDSYSPPASFSSSSSSLSNYSTSSAPQAGTPAAGMSGNIRIRLSDSGSVPATTFTLSYPVTGEVNGSTAGGGLITLLKDGDKCVAQAGGTTIASGIVRTDPEGGTVAVTSWQKANNRFRGIIECRVTDGTLTLINELSLEDYMAGLAEEPDTEPYEKQRAFAVAARTYAAFYTDPANRKFPGKPFDGSDSPAEFQVYGGVAFEEQNPRWAQAVRETAGQVLTVGGQVIKPPYFSSDDGRTRSPAEAGWKNFPFADVFASKPDPWCNGMTLRGHGVGMSGCGAKGQAYEGRQYREILQYYYPGTALTQWRN